MRKTFKLCILHLQHVVLSFVTPLLWVKEIWMKIAQKAEKAKRQLIWLPVSVNSDFFSTAILFISSIISFFSSSFILLVMLSESQYSRQCLDWLKLLDLQLKTFYGNDGLFDLIIRYVLENCQFYIILNDSEYKEYTFTGKIKKHFW